MPLVDSHCHLDSPRFDTDREDVIRRAHEAGVEVMVAIGSGDGPPDLEAGIRVAEGWPSVYATVGVAPHDARKADSTTWPRLTELAAHPKIVAFGEIGLEYFHDFSPRDVQREVFVRQLEIARDARLPVVIHCRDAWDETFRLLGEQWDPALGGILHCFTGGPNEAARALELGFHVSFSDIVTFPASEAIQEAAKMVPEDRLLIETDAPYLAPVPHRRQRNEPAFLAATAARLAELRGVSAEEIASQTSLNWRRLCLRQTGSNG